MSQAMSYLEADFLLEDSCQWQQRIGESEDSGTLDDTQLYAGATTLACLINQPSARWLNRHPDMQLTRALEFALPHDCTVKVRDRLIYDDIIYRVVDVASWAGAGVIALGEMQEGITL
jgi:hypothetical protein